jgi:hypothetical protein
MYRNAKASGLTSGRLRMLHTSSAKLFNPNGNAQPTHEQVQVAVDHTCVMFAPYFGSILAGKDLNTGDRRREIPLTFYRVEGYFARGSAIYIIT